MTTLTDTQVVTASGGLVELGYSQITSNVTITSTNAASPQIVIPDLTVVSDGSPLLVEFSYTNLNIGPGMAFGFWVDGARQGNLGIPPGSSGGNFFSRLVLSAGSHTVRVVGWLGVAGTATLYASNGTSGNDNPAFLRVSKIVQATQWPAVTTGTIICTSTTRPASPFEGQRIYETDTNKEWVYDGAAWYTPGAYVVDVAATSTFTIASGAGAGLVDITGVTQSASLVGGRRYSASLHVPQITGTTGDRFAVKILAGGSVIQASYGGIVSQGVPVCLWGTFTGSGTTTIKAQCARDVGSGATSLYADAQSPIRLTVIDIGPA